MVGARLGCSAIFLAVCHCIFGGDLGVAECVKSANLIAHPVVGTSLGGGQSNNFNAQITTMKLDGTNFLPWSQSAMEGGNGSM